jgi:hypothetical protein
VGDRESLQHHAPAMVGSGARRDVGGRRSIRCRERMGAVLRSLFAKLEEALPGNMAESTRIYSVWVCGGCKTNRLILDKIDGVRVVR